MIATIEAADLDQLRFRDKVAFSVRARLNAVQDKEAVRRGAALFALPFQAADGAKLIWGTADAIWRALGDTSEDINWYTKRATLSGVYASCVVYWLGDDSIGAQATDAFIDRRIDDVMQFEKAKAQMINSNFLGPFMAPLSQMAAMIKAPANATARETPGKWSRPE
jgi:ubiquinone biosynthesis protein COQ9